MITGEFFEPKLENEFFSYMLEETIQHFRHNLLLTSFLFLLFLIPDYYLITDHASLNTIFLIRILFFLLSVLYYFRIQYMPHTLYVFSTVYENILAILFWGLLFFYEHPDLVIHQQGLTVLILAIFFIIPNRFYMKVLISTITATGFFLIAFYRTLFSVSSYSWGLLVFSGLILVFCAMTPRRINRLQRIQFQNALQLAKISNTDALTGTNNRLKYNEELKNEISRSRRYKLPLAGIMFDLDNFKEINDKFGHLEGDKVLKKVTFLIQNIIRKNDQLFRWGGEEFIILLPNTDQDAAVQMAQRIKDCIGKAQFFSTKSLTCSFGVTSLRGDDTGVSFTNRLDQLQYTAKNKGKDCIVDNLVNKNLSLFELGEEKYRIESME
jgi:two-component system, cell cycle response regulator